MSAFSVRRSLLSFREDSMISLPSISRMAVLGRALVLCLVVLGLLLTAARAEAAPSIGVQAIRDQSSVARNDEYMSYTVKVTNTSPTAATCNPNTWTGTPAPTFGFQWLRDGVAIAGATSASYTPVVADQGRYLQCQVTGTNTGGASVQVAAPSYFGATPVTNGIVTAATKPTIDATAASSGNTLTCTAPTGWGGGPIVWSFQWLRNGVPATGTTATPTATTSTYLVQASDATPGAVLQCKATATTSAGSVSSVSLNKLTSPAPTTPPVNTAANIPTQSGADWTSGTTTVALDMPNGFRLGTGSGTGWTCRTVGDVCTSTTARAPGAALPDLKLELWLYPDEAPLMASVNVTAFGGGATADALAQDAFVFAPAVPFGFDSFTARALDQAGDDYAIAGGHPFRGTATFKLKTRRDTLNRLVPAELLRDNFTELPAGFVGNLNSVPAACTVAEVSSFFCPSSSAVGVARTVLEQESNGPQLSPLYRVKPDRGYAAAFAFAPHSESTLTIVLRAKLRADGDYGVTVAAPLVPQTPPLFEARDVSICSYGATVIDINTGLEPEPGRRGAFQGCKQPGDPGAKSIPFLTNPTECTPEPPVTRTRIDSWNDIGALNSEAFPDLSDPAWKSYESVAPNVVGCDQVPFDPSMTVAPTSAAPDSASGLDVDLDVPQDGLVDPDGIATSHLKKTVVKLPAGLTVNPSSASGLKACGDSEFALRSSSQPGCPDASVIGTVDVTSPLVDKPLTGVMYLAQPQSTDPTSGKMLRLFLSVRNDDLGLSAKVEGSAVADPVTGQLTATFDENPRVPFDHLQVDLKGGPRGVLATPQDCGAKTTETALTPWSGTGTVDRPSDTEVQGDCSERFAPDLEAGSSDNRGRGQGGTYSFKFSRRDGEQWLRGLTAKLPQGLLASVRDVPLCTNSAADAGNCPADSKIGIVDAKAGAGDPFVLEQKGEVFLTQGYKGGQYGLAVKIRPVAGPFRGDMELSPIVVRQAIHVDRTTAQVTAISDPFPLIHHGIPLRAREVTVLVNRAGFMLNPSDCDPKQTSAELLSAENATSDQTDPFQVSGCANLPFQPKLALALTGKRQVTTGKHPGIKAQVTQAGTSEAGIEKAVVRLPKSLALDPNNAQALCEFADGTKPDLENHCPKGSIVGRARAKTPLLKDDLVGNVYFVKNIRIDPTTGNQIRTLPMIIVALRGEIAINLKGESDTTNAGKLVNTFNQVPDAPISQFNLNIQGGSTGIIAVTRTRKAKINLCTGRHTAETDMDAHNGRRHDTNVRMKTPCTRKQTKAAKRAAAKARAGSKRR